MDHHSGKSVSSQRTRKSRVCLLSVGGSGILVLALLGGILVSCAHRSGEDYSPTLVGQEDGLAREMSTQARQRCEQIPSTNDVAKLAFSDNEARQLSDKGETSVILVDYCNGDWAHWSTFGTSDSGTPGYWNGDKWIAVEADGKKFDFECYSESHLASMGAPSGLIERTNLCQPGDPNTIFFTAPGDGHSPIGAVGKSEVAGGAGSSTRDATNGAQRGESGPAAAAALGSPWKEIFSQVEEFEIPQCDGHYVLVVKSEILPEVRPMPLASDIVSGKYPGVKTSIPAACPSLRGFVEDTKGRDFVEPSYNGGSIVPIYYDYGFDLAGACAARSHYSDSYVRSLTDIKGDYNDPCR